MSVHDNHCLTQNHDPGPHTYMQDQQKFHAASNSIRTSADRLQAQSVGRDYWVLRCLNFTQPRG